MPAAKRPPVVWLEVEDFLRYFDHFRNPTGVQRAAFEIFVESDRLYGRSGRLRFCRLSVYTRQFQVVGFKAILSAYLNPPGAGAPWTTIWGPAALLAKLSGVLPIVIRHPRFFLALSRTAIGDLAGGWVRRWRFGRQVRPGDIVVSLGAGWGFPNYVRHIADAKRRYGVRFAALVHDLIPIENEAFVEPWHAVQFRTWLQDVLPVADVLLTLSHYGRDALIRWAAEAGLVLPPVAVMQLGSGLTDRPMAGEEEPVTLPERHVLFVSTIEFRKNHRLLVTVWRRLLERHGADAVPVLIFAGQIGWRVDDLLAGLQKSENLGGKIVIMPGLSDAALRQAYRACLFTVFPSLAEGWGLPVAESLTEGKCCVASNRTSIPEVGGGFVDYFDPLQEADALAKIERLLFDPDYLAARQARLLAEYRPPSWADCVHTLMRQLDTGTGASPDVRATAPVSLDAGR